MAPRPPLPSPTLTLALLRAGDHPSPAAEATSEASTQRVTGGDPVRAILLAGGVVKLQEERLDGSPGLSLDVPPDEDWEAWQQWFTRIIIKRQKRKRLRLI